VVAFQVRFWIITVVVLAGHLLFGGNQNFKEAFLQIVEKLWNIFN
jgi:hypothetical protein